MLNKINMVLIWFWFWFWGKWVSIWDNRRYHLAELGTWSSVIVCGSMDFVNKDLASRVSPQSLRNFIWACPCFSNKKEVRIPWSTCESPLGSGGFSPLGSDLLSPQGFSSLWRLRNLLTHDWSHSFPLFLTCLRNLVGNSGQTSEVLILFSHHLHWKPFREYLRMTIAMMCPRLPKVECSEDTGGPLFYFSSDSIMPFSVHRGWGGLAHRGSLDDSPGSSRARRQNSWVETSSWNGLWTRWLSWQDPLFFKKEKLCLETSIENELQWPWV